MKIISESQPRLYSIEMELAGNEPGIVVLPEGSWDNPDGVKFKDFLAATLDYRVSIIGTRKGRQEFDIAYVLIAGKAKPVGVYIHDDLGSGSQNAKDLYSNLSRPHNVSPTKDPILALIKQCSEIHASPLADDCKVDLVCVPSSIDHTVNNDTRDLIIRINRRNISENSLFVQAVSEDINGTGIFRLPSFDVIGKKHNGYAVHQYSR